MGRRRDRAARAADVGLVALDDAEEVLLDLELLLEERGELALLALALELHEREERLVRAAEVQRGQDLSGLCERGKR